jgi:glycopeptide antibiotics resistance protein
MTDNKPNKTTIVLFIIYLITLFWIIVLKFNIPFSNSAKRINLIPFNEPLILNGKPDVGELILNILIFIPLGIYAGVIFKRWNIGKKLLLFFLISLLCEVFQFIFAIGTSDITDIITNTIGGLTGLMICIGIEKAFRNSEKAQKFINIIGLIGTISIFLILSLLKINHLWIFRMNSLHI